MGSGPTSAGGASPSVVEASPSATPNLVEAGSVEIGDGRSLYRVCRGEGSPTVILNSGDGSDASEWDPVITQIAEVTKVCAYDRGGLGHSDPVTGCRHLADLTGDMDQLLEAANIPGPYVVVGARFWSRCRRSRERSISSLVRRIRCSRVCQVACQWWIA